MIICSLGWHAGRSEGHSLCLCLSDLPDHIRKGRHVRTRSVEVSLDGAGKLLWKNDVETTQKQPARDGLQPIADWFFMLFPKRFY